MTEMNQGKTDLRKFSGTGVIRSMAETETSIGPTRHTLCCLSDLRQPTHGAPLSKTVTESGITLILRLDY
ncbi:MAG: hypothetical protein AABY93_16895 [Bacteroidota bacterium]